MKWFLTRIALPPPFFSSFDIVCLFFCFAFLFLFFDIFVFILIENFPLKNIARLYEARLYFVVDKEKRLRLRWTSTILRINRNFLSEIKIVKFILFHGKRTFLLFGFSTKIMSEEYSSKCVKFYTSWFFTSSCNWTFLLTFKNIF